MGATGVGPWVLRPGDSGYPEHLRDTPAAPDFVYGIGQQDRLTPGVAIIGSRNATPYGVRAATAVAQWSAQIGLVVYSGAARGCDQAAQAAALDAGGSSVAVLGCGPDVVYPESSRGLLARCVQSGAVVSQFEPGTRPAKWRFPQRNWLIAALSICVVVVEGRVPSGTFSTVGHAQELGRDVCAVPGSIFSIDSDAPNRLITDGAHPITCAEDLATVCGLSLGGFTTQRGSAGSSKAPNDVERALLREPLTVLQIASHLNQDSRLVAIELGNLVASGAVAVDLAGRYHVTEQPRR